MTCNVLLIVGMHGKKESMNYGGRGAKCFSV